MTIHCRSENNRDLTNIFANFLYAFRVTFLSLAVILVMYLLLLLLSLICVLITVCFIPFPGIEL